MWLEVLIVPLTGATAQIIPPFEWPSKSTELQPWEHYLFALVYIFLQLYSTKQAYYDGIWEGNGGFPKLNAAFHVHTLEPVVQVLRYRSQLRPRWFRRSGPVKSSDVTVSHEGVCMCGQL